LEIRYSQNRRLVIGAYHFTTCSSQTYIQANNSRDVLAGLYLISILLLENFTERGEFSRITDSLMLQIKESSSPTGDLQSINCNSFGRVNRAFGRFVIDFLAVQLVFNNWFPFKCQTAPSPYVCKNSPEADMAAIKKNQKILISLVLNMNPRAHSLLLNPGRLGWDSPNRKKIFTFAQHYKNKFDKGIISSWGGFPGKEFKVS
jgi:hypothetical protein